MYVACLLHCPVPGKGPSSYRASEFFGWHVLQKGGAVVSIRALLSLLWGFLESKAFVVCNSFVSVRGIGGMVQCDKGRDGAGVIRLGMVQV